MTRIVLTPAEMLLAGQAGLMRQIENVAKGRKHAHALSEDAAESWQMHIEGCLAEMAVAKCLGIYWEGKGKLRAPDVGEVDVRCTKHRTGRLIIHEQDPDDRRFYLVVGENGVYDVVGWITGAEGKVGAYWQDPTGGRPAYFVPQSTLRAA